MNDKSKEPLISVIVPVYNAADCLARCVGSIAGQTYENLEILLVNDGSKDESGKLAAEWAKKDARIHVLHQENKGSSAARNLGMEDAQGEYLGFVDADDEVLPEMYQKLLEAAKAAGNEAKKLVFQAGRQEIAPDGTRLPDICKTPAKETFLSSETFFRELLLHRGDCSFCTKLFPRELISEARFPEGELNEDFKLFLTLLPRMKGILALPQDGYLVHYKEESNSRTKDPEAFPQVFTDIVRNADFAYELACREYPAFQKEALRFSAYQRLEYLLHIPVSKMNKDNAFYLDVVKWTRKHLLQILASPYLTGKNKLYLLLLGAAPKMVRAGHKKLKRL